MVGFGFVFGKISNLDPDPFLKKGWNLFRGEHLDSKVLDLISNFQYLLNIVIITIDFFVERKKFRGILLGRIRDRVAFWEPGPAFFDGRIRFLKYGQIRMRIRVIIVGRSRIRS